MKFIAHSNTSISPVSKSASPKFPSGSAPGDSSQATVVSFSTPTTALHPSSVTSIESTVNTSCSPGLPLTSLQPSVSFCGPAATLGEVGLSVPSSRSRFEATANPASVAPATMRTMIVVRLIVGCSHTGTPVSRRL